MAFLIFRLFLAIAVRTSQASISEHRMQLRRDNEKVKPRVPPRRGPRGSSPDSSNYDASKTMTIVVQADGVVFGHRTDSAFLDETSDLDTMSVHDLDLWAIHQNATLVLSSETARAIADIIRTKIDTSFQPTSCQDKEACQQLDQSQCNAAYTQSGCLYVVESTTSNPHEQSNGRCAASRFRCTEWHRNVSTTEPTFGLQFESVLHQSNGEAYSGEAPPLNEDDSMAIASHHLAVIGSKHRIPRQYVHMMHCSVTTERKSIFKQYLSQILENGESTHNRSTASKAVIDAGQESLCNVKECSVDGADYMDNCELSAAHYIAPAHDPDFIWTHGGELWHGEGGHGRVVTTCCFNGVDDATTSILRLWRPDEAEKCKDAVGLTWTQADAFCKSGGKRLCTATELFAAERTTRCSQFDDALTWTSETDWFDPSHLALCGVDDECLDEGRHLAVVAMRDNMPLGWQDVLSCAALDATGHTSSYVGSHESHEKVKDEMQELLYDGSTSHNRKRCCKALVENEDGPEGSCPRQCIPQTNGAASGTEHVQCDKETPWLGGCKCAEPVELNTGPFPLAVTCCHIENEEVLLWRPSECPLGKTWLQSKELCEAQNKRLCTCQELLYTANTNLREGDGGGHCASAYDKALTWTSQTEKCEDMPQVDLDSHQQLRHHSVVADAGN